MNTKPIEEHTRDWWAQVHASAADLRNLIEDYHPASADFRMRSRAMSITAPGPEQACEIARREIQSEQCGLDAPVIRFDQALAANDAEAICGLLSSAWFGVPESSDCWDIPAFSLSCDLMDDPPESVQG